MVGDGFAKGREVVRCAMGWLGHLTSAKPSTDKNFHLPLVWELHDHKKV